MTLDERLDQLAAAEDSEITVGREAGQDLESFQATVNRLHRYRDEGLVEIVSEKRDSRSAERYVARVRLRLTPGGVEWA